MPASTPQQPPVAAATNRSAEVERLKSEIAAKDAEVAAIKQEVARERAHRESQGVDLAVVREARDRFVYPDAAPRLIDRARVIVDRRTGKPDLGSVRDAIDNLLGEYPDLAHAPSGGGSPSAQPARRPTQGRDGRFQSTSDRSSLIQALMACGEYQQM